MVSDSASAALKNRAAESPLDKGKVMITKPESFGELLGSEMVDIYVGKGDEKKHFRVHKGILCQKIPYFDRMFNSTFKEGLSNRAEFPEDCADTFEILQEWVDTGSLPNMEVLSKVENTTGSNDPILNFCILLDKLCLLRLLDEFVSSYINNHMKKGVLPSCEYITEAYNNLPSSIKFRRYYLLTFHYILNGMSRDCDIRQKNWPPEEMKKTIESSSAFRIDLIDLLWGHPKEEEAEDPRYMPRCTFHKHGENEECPVKSKD